jgi:hypothetical protein
VPHGDAGDARYANCGCSHCTLTRRFLAFRDNLPPDRPAAITTRREAAAYLKWHAAQIIELVEQAEEGEA